MTRRIFAASVVPSIIAGLSVFLLMSAGCLVVGKRSIDERGLRVTDQTFRQIEPGVTTEAWLLATLGEPTGRSVVAGDERVRVLRYEHEIRETAGGTVFLIWAGRSDETRRTTTYFEITDGVVTRYWRES